MACPGQNQYDVHFVSSLGFQAGALSIEHGETMLYLQAMIKQVSFLYSIWNVVCLVDCRKGDHGDSEGSVAIFECSESF